jgi:flavin-dependent dehydrogenase
MKICLIGDAARGRAIYGPGIYYAMRSGEGSARYRKNNPR